MGRSHPKPVDFLVSSRDAFPEGNGHHGKSARIGTGRSGSQSAKGLLEALESRLLLSVAISDTALTSNPDVQQYPSIAVDPHDSRHIVVSYMDRSLLTTGYDGIGVEVSHDGGASWLTTSIPLPTGFNQGAADPKTAFDDQGHVQVSFMAATFLGTLPPVTNPKGAAARADGFQSSNGIFIARSDDGGTTWAAPVSVVSNTYNGINANAFEMIPDLAIDTYKTLPNGTLNPNYGNEYVTYTTLYPPGAFPGDPTSSGGGAILLAVSTDGGQTWHQRLQQQAGVAVTTIGASDDFFTGRAPAGLTGQTYAQVVVGPEGDIYVSYYMFGYDFVVHSADAGNTFTVADPNTSDGVPFNFGSYVGSSTESQGGGVTNAFRTFPVRDIVADPTRPGTLYVVEGIATFDTSGAYLDYGDIFFARSTDYGHTWQSTVKVDGRSSQVLNDDNGGQVSTGGPNDVASAQSMPSLAIDPQGNIAVIWYDTRHDPANHLLDVYGTVSTDGGQSFSANFRLTTASFDANAGAFTDPTNTPDFYLGDRLGLAIANGDVYAGWTDTLAGNQDLQFTAFPLNSLPAIPDDQYDPNNTSSTAANLGVVITRHVPRLATSPDADDWFSFTAAATGRLSIQAQTAQPSVLDLQLWSADGSTLLVDGTSVSGLSYAGSAGAHYLLRVSTGQGGGSVAYALDLQSLTANLGTIVLGSEAGTLSSGDQAYYQLSPAASGSVTSILTPAIGFQGNLSLEVLDATTLDGNGNPVILQSVTGAGMQQLTLAVAQNHPLLVRVSGSGSAAGHFQLDIVNLDQLAAGLGSGLEFPAGNGPSQVVLVDVNNDRKPDLVVSDAFSNTVSILLANGDGTFQAPREFALGALLPAENSMLPQLDTFKRGLAVGDLNDDGNPDIVVTNPASGDVSVLLGNGDGSFKPQRRFDATVAPNSVSLGDFNGDGIPDMAVLSSTAALSDIAILRGRGDGTFQAEVLIQTPLREALAIDDIQTADLNGDGRADLIITGSADQNVYVYLGRGDGTFAAPLAISGVGQGAKLIIADLNGDSIPDLITANPYNDNISYALGTGNGTFGPVNSIFSGQSPLGVAVADVGSEDGNGHFVLGNPDGQPDLIVADAGFNQTQFNGPAAIVVLPGLRHGNGFAGFDSPQTLASATAPESIVAGDVNGDGVEDITYVDRDGVHVLYGKAPTIAPNDSPHKARNLGVVVHVVEPTLTIIPGHEDAYYIMTVPAEAVAGAGDEIVDIAGEFSATSGPGLSIEVLNAAGAILGTGSDVRIMASAGTVLTIHVLGVPAAGGVRGAGAFALDIDVLPQVVSVQAESVLPGIGTAPGGPVTSFVITLQGDRLDATAAADAANYTVTWFGPDGKPGTSDDRQIQVESVVYSPAANVDVATGITYPEAVRQTVTLLFTAPLPAGSYRIDLSAHIQSADFNSVEQETGPAHPVVSRTGGYVTPGATVVVSQLVPADGISSFTQFQSGTPFLTQLHDDLGALLDFSLSSGGDSTTITSSLLSQILLRIKPGLTTAVSAANTFLVLFLDPVSFDLADPSGSRITFSLTTGGVLNQIGNAFVSVANNVELILIPFDTSTDRTLVLNVGDVPAGSRGGYVLLGLAGESSVPLTGALRTGVRQFTIDVPGQPGLSGADAPFFFNTSFTGSTALPNAPQADGVIGVPIRSVSQSTGESVKFANPLSLTYGGSDPGDLGASGQLRDAVNQWLGDVESIMSQAITTLLHFLRATIGKHPTAPATHAFKPAASDELLPPDPCATHVPGNGAIDVAMPIVPTAPLPETSPKVRFSPTHSSRQVPTVLWLMLTTSAVGVTKSRLKWRRRPSLESTTNRQRRRRR